MADRDPNGEEEVREAVERSRSGAPAAGRVIRDRFSSDEVFQRIIAAADEEITSGSRELYFSGLAAGFAITITFLLYVSLTASTDADPVLSAMLYPLGFIYIIIGGYQLYTENTLPPVALTLERLASIPALLRNWAVVLAGNFTGGALGAAALAYGNVLSADASTAALSIAQKGIDADPVALFTKAAFAGLIVAGVVWVNYASQDTISRLVVVYLAFLSIPIGGLFHVVVSFTEMLYLVFVGAEGVTLWIGMTEFVIPVLAGNTVGGVVLVTAVNYFQTSEYRLESARFEGAYRRLSPKEWLFGGLFGGRRYVPVIDTAAKHTREESTGYRILVPIANPRTEQPLVKFASAIASAHEDATVHAVHIVQTPHQGYDSAGRRRIVEESDRLMADVCSVTDDYEVDVETSTVVSHRSFEELFTVAGRDEADLVVMGWGEDRLWDAARAEQPLEELTNSLPCDFLVVDDEGMDSSQILLPTVGGPNSDLSAEVVAALQSVEETEVTLLYVVDDPAEIEDGEQFLSDWAADHGLEDAEIVVDDSGDVEAAIEREAAAHTMVFLGASERGLLARLVRNTLHMDILDDVESSVVIAERATRRSLWRRLFGR
ncbi:formate/nitrite transporter family protein [Halapricum salinum]|uniref:Formate transporter n=1 Tax=Halapricum salinum TaxID=1457250 RepID=A0A4D6H9E0_9EURY|nr:formate/nitrite transporter family protein [Halapricum salinum]QCC49816.1 formate transporter [Halapricum salinum]